MGYDVYSIDGALYGFKTELKEMLRNGEVPNWLAIPTRVKRGMKLRGKSMSTASYLAEELEDPWTRKYGGCRLQFDATRTEDSKNVTASRTPTLIADKCQSWLESNRDGIEYSDGNGSFVEFREFELLINVGERGGIRDVWAVAKFKNH